MATTQAEMFPDDVPEFPREYWRAVKRWYSSGVTRGPTREEFVLVFRPRVSLRSFDRKKAKPENKKWLGKWPPKYGQRPPWETDDHKPVGQDILKDDDKLAPAGSLAARLREELGKLPPGSPAEPEVTEHPSKKVKLLAYEDDGTIRPLPAVLDLLDGKLHLERLLPALVALRMAAGFAGACTPLSHLMHRLIHHGQSLLAL